MKPNEYIITSAIYVNDGIKHIHQPKNIEIGYVVCGRRHHNCYQTVSILIGKRKRTLFEKINTEEGFITNTDRFVGREEAAVIALSSGQIDTNISKLHSEDLY